ncbi:hypothetical protein SAY86_001002 [Trapa natans]|uniref:Pyruvate decarboxylase n=1 Tax=Trapa natans TaxID=22666 RepID=A0AAN7MCW6_TRANT|nr:hypothetical protein SAY86_001002 [Trapa natans]
MSRRCRSKATETGDSWFNGQKLRLPENCGSGQCWTAKVKTEEELVEAIVAAKAPPKASLCFIEVILHKDDTSEELLKWGSRVSAANSRPPNPQ